MQTCITRLLAKLEIITFLRVANLIILCQQEIGAQNFGGCVSV